MVADDADTQLEPVRTIADVQREDAEFLAAASQQTFDEAAELAALQSLMSGDARGKAEAACAALNQSPKWAEAQDAWSRLKKDNLALSVRKVVEDLEAPHLKPTGIASRLENGVHATCFGLFTLLQNLSAVEQNGNAP